MKIHSTRIRGFFLLLAIPLLAVSCINEVAFSQEDTANEQYPAALINHVDDWNKKQAVMGQKPDTYIEIDQLAFYDNIQLVRTQLLSDETKLMVVIKSDAYGNGLEMLAGVAELAGADYFGITENSSVKILRDLGLKVPIQRLRLASNDELLTVHSNPGEYGNVEEMVGNLQMAQLLSQLGEQQNRSIKIHLNLNAGGMARNGFDLTVPNIEDELLSLLELKNIQIAGIMTHFPNADAEDLTATRTSLEKFKEQANWIIESGGLNRAEVLLHVANTSATLRLPEAHLDMVRLGSLVLGEKLEEEAPDAIQNLMSVYSTVGQINYYPEGSSVGYGSNDILRRDSYLANIPIGKVNGIPRDLVEVLIGGKRYPMVGSMSMNTTMIDITDGWQDIDPGDRVVIFGKQGNDEITVDEHWLPIISDVHTFMGQLNYKARYAKPLPN